MTLRYFYRDDTYIYHRDKRWWGKAERKNLEECLKSIIHATVENHQPIYDKVDSLDEKDRIPFMLNFLEKDKGRGVQLLYLKNEDTGDIYFDHRDQDVIIPF